MIPDVPLFRPLLHGSYVDDILFGAIFVVGVAVFIYFFFADPGESDTLDGAEENQTDR